VVNSAAAAAAAMSSLEEHDVFAVDLEGVELGRGGTISILQVIMRCSMHVPRAMSQLCAQVAVLAADGACDVYIFDILQLGAEAFASGLGAMLGSSRALKLMFDARSDADALWHGWGVHLKGVFDLQVAHILAFASNCRHLPSLLSVIENSSGVSEAERSRARAAKTSGPTIGADGCYNSRVWLQRPLEASLLKYAAGDVAVLLPLYRHTAAALQLQLQSDDLVMHISQKRIVASTESSAGRARGSDRDFFESFVSDAEAAADVQRKLISALRERYF
jgi:ribonuclease D